MKKTQGIILSILFMAMLLAGGAGLIAGSGKTYSEAERRPLAETPEADAESIIKGRFFKNLDLFVTDHFQPREDLRHLKAVWQLSVMHETENNGLVEAGGSLVKLEKQIHEASVQHAKERFRTVFETYPALSDCRLYSALIPDKSYFLRDQGYPVMDLRELERQFQDILPEASYIPLADTLELADYYLTDSHWRQDRIPDAANRLLQYMGKEGDLKKENFTEKVLERFRGVYAGQSALDPAPETIVYLTGGLVENCTAIDPADRKPVPLYDSEGCDPRDLYTLFLGGSKGLVRITNPDASGKGELVIFRDSFASSLAPLLSAEYETVTLVDLRYVHPSVIGRYITFYGQDVLFLFSATLLNSSQGLR